MARSLPFVDVVSAWGFSPKKLLRYTPITECRWAPGDNQPRNSRSRPSAITLTCWW
jgi:hypothetical protein